MLIGLHGKKRHGKSTVAAHLVTRYGFSRLPLAGAIKDVICRRVLRMSDEHLEGSLKEVPCVLVERPAALAGETIALLFPSGGLPYLMTNAELAAQWEAIWAPLCNGHPRSPREIMQAVGGGARTRISESVWIDLWRDSYQHRPRDAHVVVDDVRFPNELDLIRSEGGNVWRVVRTDLPDSGDCDATEVACDRVPDAAFTAVLRRPTGVQALLGEVDRLMAHCLPVPAVEAAS